MASKFQNRLVGTVVLVALGVIVLPGLLDGKKKHYEDEFAAIPLVPKPGDTLEAESMPPVNQSLPAQPPEGAEAAMQNKNNADADTVPEPTPAPAVPERRGASPSSSHPATPAAPLVTEPRQPVQQLAPPAMKAQPAKPEPKKPETKADTRPKPEVKAAESKTADNKSSDSKPSEKPVAEAKTDTRATENRSTENKPADAKAASQEQAPAGQAFVVQLGALKNADKVNEIVAKLRLSGYRAYTVPSAPVAGQITRIYVGPDASKQKLQSALGDLQQLSGLSGQVRSYSAR
ncbi:cell division protein DedD [Dickeya zeae]|uniref:Cell division protein DedD n=1 Tax=Dickeya zeae TaxID=204042 RepID=A0ABX8VRC2_9GAMM|nr:cell division protein DedD [Dickeya zeae]MCO7260557.1 cell division protein DedD [Dickeya zeae]QYM90367.1 cell division protein DedD [Dickeya zeae]